MGAHLRKRSFTLNRHRTSIALEPEFWAALAQAAVARSVTETQLICTIDDARTTPLASALRVWLFDAQRAAQGEQR